MNVFVSSRNRQQFLLTPFICPSLSVDSSWQTLPCFTAYSFKRGRCWVSQLSKGVDLSTSWWRVECPLVANGKNACSKAGINFPEDVCFREYCVPFKQAPALETQCLHLYSWKNSQLKVLCFPYTKLLNSLNISIKSPEVRNRFKRQISTETFTEDAFSNTLCMLFQKPFPRAAPLKKRHAFAPQQLPIGILRLDLVPAQLSSSHPHQNQNLESSFPKTWTTTESWTLLHSLGPEIRDEMFTVAFPALT